LLTTGITTFAPSIIFGFTVTVPLLAVGITTFAPSIKLGLNVDVPLLTIPISTFLLVLPVYTIVQSTLDIQFGIDSNNSLNFRTGSRNKIDIKTS
jgi:hypothetical protein